MTEQVYEDTFAVGDLVQIIHGQATGIRGFIRTCPIRASAEFGMWERTDERGVERVYVEFGETIASWVERCEHGSLGLSISWGWCKREDIMKIAQDPLNPWHGGKLDENYQVYRDKWGVTFNRDGLVLRTLRPIAALELLAWLRQEEAALQELAKEIPA